MNLTRSVAQSSLAVLIDSTLHSFQGLGFVVCFVGFFCNWEFDRIKASSSRQWKWGDYALSHATWYKSFRGMLTNLNKYNSNILKRTQVIESQDLKFCSIGLDRVCNN